MTQYRFAAGYNNGTLADWPIMEPRCTGLKAGRRLVSGNGQVIEDGFNGCQLMYSYLTKPDLETLLAFTGLDDSPSVECTITLPRNLDRDFIPYNAILVRPDHPDEGQQTMGKWVDVRFTVQRIEGTTA